jgi:hypothetical protein
MEMTVTELRENIGRFGELKAGNTGYKKTLNGFLRDMDTRGTIWFVDNDGFGYSYKNTLVDSFTPKVFEPLPTEYHGKDVRWVNGKLYADGKEIDLKK